MNLMRATEVHRNIYRLLDRILETGEPLVIEHGGRRLRIELIEESSRVARLRALGSLNDLVVGDPAALDDVDWTSSWRA